jgi:hypothetical protein
VLVQRLQHAAKYVDPNFIPERALREDAWTHVGRNFHTHPLNASSGKKASPKRLDFERRSVTPSPRRSVALLAFTDYYDVFSHLSAKWRAN